MKQIESLESLIRRYIFLGKRSPKGYEIVKCANCNDYKTRGGFKFEGESVHYQCFNCSTSTGYDPDKSRHSISEKFKSVLIAFGIPEEEIENCISFNFFKPKDQQVQNNPITAKTGFPTKEVPLPNDSVKITSNESPWCEVAIQYITDRKIASSDFEFYVTNESSYQGRLLIPYWFKNKIIYWQGRSMDDETISPRYKNPTVEKDNIFFNMDEIYRYTNEPLFVCEGPLDAISIGKNAVALTGSTLSEFKLNELRKAALRRRVIFVIDKNLPGYKLGHQILQYEQGLEFYITVFPDNVEDANDALKKFGRLWIISHLSTTACNGFSGKLLLELNCSKS